MITSISVFGIRKFFMDLFSSKEELKEAERFEDWFHRINPERKIDPDVFNSFHQNIKKTVKNEVYGKKNRR
jgi:hypothetical protein